ncbi:HAD family hydrolase [Thomasclavelia ramosa]|uniref:HAD family hydrolase n=1 Tax=Thomasclavelia ramosa TaxID=1547 RepID=UPI000E5108D7|nr:HAD family hydrolase [Thomasclavelia ramosa]RGX64803.1 HAD family hydrolase [Thomasclavelia ramosa]
MKPMIFFDVDGTLMDNHDYQVTPSTKKALQKLQENGYKIGIATGRAVNSLKRTGVVDIANWDGFICNNGQTVLNKNFQIVEELVISPEIVHRCIKIAKDNNIPLALKMEHRIITQEPDENVYTARKFFNSIIPPVGIYQNQKVEAMIAYGPKGYDYAPFKQLEGLHILPGVSTYCDITHADATKATGIQVILKQYNLDKYICFGDSLNDVEMFNHAAISICMGQGDAYLKNIATFVTDSIDDDGIYNACINLGLFK